MALVVLEGLITATPHHPVHQGNRRVIALRFVQLFLYFILVSYTGMMNIYSVTADAAAPTNEQKYVFGENSYKFAQKIFNVIATEEPNKNVLLSPFSIQTSVGTVRFGATGETAQELDRGLNLLPNDTEATAQLFKATLERYKNSTVLKIANRVFIRKGLEVEENFKNTIEKYLSSETEEVDFSNATQSVTTINSWISNETSSVIKEIILPTDIDSMLQIVLVNGIYFKGEWKTKFNVAKTHMADFFINKKSSVKVKMMELQGSFFYADLPKWNATVLEMPYNNTDLSMLILLPNSDTDLSTVMEKMKGTSLKTITEEMQSCNVHVKLPKFHAEYSADLRNFLPQLGIHRVFLPGAELDGILKGYDSIAVSKVVHKTYIDVNEAGTEAAAATGVMAARSLPMTNIVFEVNKPFFYLVKNIFNTTLFCGSIVTFN